MIPTLDEKLEIFQTLEHRGNRNEVEAHGPFSCTKKNAWLGYGYYFWDSSIDNAHSWGYGFKKKGKDYYITSCKADLDNSNCFNLLEPKYKNYFNQIVDEMCKGYNKKSSEIIVLDVVEFLRTKVTSFRNQYLAIKVQSDKSSKKLKNAIKFSYSEKSNDYFDTQSYVQICVFEDADIKFEGFRVIFDSKVDAYL